LCPQNADRQFPGHPEAKVLIKLNKEKDEVRKPGYLEAVKLKGETGEGYSGPGAKATGKNGSARNQVQREVFEKEPSNGFKEENFRFSKESL